MVIIKKNLQIINIGEDVEKKELPDGSVVKNLPASAGNASSIPAGLRKIPWRRKGKPTPVFLPGKSHGQRSLLGSSMGS